MNKFLHQFLNRNSNISLPHREGLGRVFSLPPREGRGWVFLLVLLVAVSCTESFEDRCRREAREYTERMCPRAMTPGMIMDSMTFVSNPIGFNYYYTLDGDLDDPELLTDDVLETFHEELLKNLRQDISLKKYKERDFTFTYTYYSRSTGEMLTEAAFTPEEYK